ncbi:MAG: hypothetical protein GX126_13740 [Bacteroidales bacterium]|nr:hypothetical protein [Bacteroidales bacterium]
MFLDSWEILPTNQSSSYDRTGAIPRKVRAVLSGQGSPPKDRGSPPMNRGKYTMNRGKSPMNRD